jgi:ABC-type multidrug transport system ATPase subunit
MGPSGSGKTTLLDLLAGRKTVGSVQGSILFAGNKPTRQFLRKFTGYVEQFGKHNCCHLAATSYAPCLHFCNLDPW